MLTLKAEKRSVLGKALKNERKAGRLPAVFYGRKEKATSVFVPYAEFLKVWKEAGESSLVNLSYPDKDMPVLITDVSFDPVRGEPIHADFYAVESDRAVEVSVPLEFIGVPPAVKEFGGVLVKVLYEVPVSGLPKDLPAEIVVDLSPLATLESRVLVKDLPVPGGITILSDKNEIVALVAEAAKEEVVEKVFDATAIEVEKKGKKEEEGELGAEGEKKEPASAGGKSSPGGKKGPEKK